jgi:DNA-binding NarL/FixJ family response regulator
MHPVYIIEDDPVAAAIMANALKNEPFFTISSYTTAEEGLEAIRSAPPRVLIIDHQLPGMTGIELFDLVKPILPSDCIIIMASAIEDGALVLKFIQKGVRNYVIKDHDLATSVKEVLAEEMEKL